MVKQPRGAAPCFFFLLPTAFLTVLSPILFITFRLDLIRNARRSLMTERQ